MCRLILRINDFGQGCGLNNNFEEMAAKSIKPVNINEAVLDDLARC